MISKAETINDFEVEGYYALLLFHWRSKGKVPVIFTGGYEIGDCGEHIDEQYEIKPETLKHKIGNKWYTEKQLEKELNNDK